MVPPWSSVRHTLPLLRDRLGFMTIWIALLRGINVGGHHRVPMDELRDLCAQAGYIDPTTYIQSGNVVFESDDEDGAALATLLEARCTKTFGFPVPVMVRSAVAMHAIIDECPFEVTDPKVLSVGFLAGPLSTGMVDTVNAASTSGESLRVHGNTAYLWLPAGTGRSKLAAAFTRRAANATLRNWRTVTALVAMAEARATTPMGPTVRSPPT